MKRYIMPTLKVIIALVIAVALTKIAFFSGDDKGTAALSPSFSVTTQTTAATKGDIANTVDVKGQVVEDAAVNAPATLDGKVESLAVKKGDHVDAGAALMVLVGQVAQPDKKVCQSDPETGQRVCTNEPQEPKTVRATVTAPASGTVSLNVIVNQETTVGTVVASVSPGTYSAVGTITPSQQYQLLNAPTEAQLEVEGGPAPFTCQGLTIGTKTTQASSGASAQGGDGSVDATTPQDATSVQVRCPIPADQKVFPGLPVTIGIDAGSAKDAILVPVTAVEGSTTKGNVWVVKDPNKPDEAKKTEVSLGINDGSNIQVTEGLKEGEEILMFVPGKDLVHTGEPNSCDEYGCYDENGQEVQ